MGIFKEHSEEEQAHSIAGYLPNGRMWINKNVPGTNFRKLLIALGKECTRVEAKKNEILIECDISQASQLLPEWEKLLGIPDEAIPIAATLTQRRNNVLFKMSIFGASLDSDYVRIASVLGKTITVTPADGGPDIPYTDYRKRFIIVVTFDGNFPTWPLTWPILWGGTDISAVQHIFEKIRPAVCNIIYRINIV